MPDRNGPAYCPHCGAHLGNLQEVDYDELISDHLVSCSGEYEDMQEAAIVYDDIEEYDRSNND